MKIEAASLAALPGIRHAFFTRRGGVSEGIYASLNGGMGSHDDPDHLTENRARMARSIGVEPGMLMACWQVHSPDAVVVTQPWTREDAPKADAVVTAIPGLGATITVADCGPVLFADPVAQVVGAAHAGWKGAFGGVIEGTLKAMEGLGTRRTDVRAVIGPLIRQQSYEVGEDFMGRFLDTERAFARFFKAAERPGHAMFNLPAFIAHRLAEAGVVHVEDLGLDTYGDEDRFFSYRRSTHRKEQDYGRLVAAITIEA